MNSWISDLLIFSAGVSGGVLICLLIPFISSGKERRTKMLHIRRRVLDDIKQKHDEEILDEALQTTAAIRNELEHSRARLERIMATVSDHDASRGAPSVNQSTLTRHGNGHSRSV